MARWIAGVLATILLPTAALAQPVDSSSAGNMLFSTRGATVEVVRVIGLSDRELGFVGEAAKQQLYYAAIAISPGDGLMSNATVAATNYHSVPAAEAAAIAACNERRENGREPCRIAARVRPTDWSNQPVQMSIGATEAFRSSYRRERGEKAFAISPSTIAWAIASGAGAANSAVSACNARSDANGAGDCVVVIAD